MNASLSTCTHLAIAEVRFQTIANLPDAIHALQLHLHHAQYTQAVVLKNQTLQVEQFGQQQMLVPGIAKTFVMASKSLLVISAGVPVGTIIICQEPVLNSG